MNEIILCICPSWGVELPPLNLALLKSALAQAGIKVQCIDLNIHTYSRLDRKELWGKNQLRYWTTPSLFEDEILPKIQDLLDEFSTLLASNEAPYLGFSILDSNIAFTNHLIRRIRQKCGKPIIAGGPEVFSKHTRVKLGPEFDFFLNGEGEESLGLWVKWMNKGQQGPIPLGIYPSQEGLFRDLPFVTVDNLSAFPCPDFEDLLSLPYQEKALPLIGSRSCLFKCRFCTDYKTMGKFRALSSEKLLETLEVIHNLGYRKVWFNDLLINGILKQLREALSKLEALGDSLEWIALATPNHQLKADDLKFFKSHGLKTLNLGLESGSEKIMRAMRKGFNREQASAALKRIHSAGINTQINLIVGYPGEGEIEFLETLEFMDKNKAFISGFTSVNTCILLPDSEIFENRQKLGIKLPEDKDPTQWTQGEENTPAIREKRLKLAKKWMNENNYAIYSSNTS
jgi:anaerobic magnesium-protoporphyrin IX monomethyl ester cyclase